MKRWDLCNEHLARFDPSRFLEIGVKGGAVGKRVKADFKIGVDPDPRPAAHLYYTKLYPQTSDDFFADNRESRLGISVVFIDGLHEAEQAMRDVLNSLHHLHPLGTIILHDCNPPDEASQIIPRQQLHWNGDVWKVIVTLRATRTDLRVHTLDTDEGLGVIMWGWGQRLIKVPEELTWKGLEKHRTEWLGLVAP